MERASFLCVCVCLLRTNTILFLLGGHPARHFSVVEASCNPVRGAKENGGPDDETLLLFGADFLSFSVFSELWGATPSSHFPPVTGRSARGRKGSQLFHPAGVLLNFHCVPSRGGNCDREVSVSSI